MAEVTVTHSVTTSATGSTATVMGEVLVVDMVEKEMCCELFRCAACSRRS